MDELKEQCIEKKGTVTEGYRFIYHGLPFFVKFMGDGLLVLWNTRHMSPKHLLNLVISLNAICLNYPTKLLPQIKEVVVSPPPALRCGVARGTVYSVGESADFVGSCINMAARIQKLPGINFAFNRRGFDLDGDTNPMAAIKKTFSIRKVAIRGIGENELLALRNVDLLSMSEVDKKFYRAL